MKIAFNGTEQWLKNFVGTSHNSPLGLEADPAGNIYCTGRYAGQLTIESNTISTPNLSPNVFVLSYSGNGTFRWIKTGGGIYDDWGNKISLLSNADVIIGGLTWTPSTYGTLSTTASGFLLTRISDPGNPPLGIETSFSENDLQIFPNPVSKELIVRSQEFGDKTEIEIYNVIGEKVVQSELSIVNYQLSINISQLLSGIYFLKVRGEGGQRVVRFVKQ